jgi:hypothetical protein
MKVMMSDVLWELEFGWGTWKVFSLIFLSSNSISFSLDATHVHCPTETPGTTKNSHATSFGQEHPQHDESFAIASVGPVFDSG